MAGEYGVEYELNLKDGLSPKIQEAEGHVSKLEDGLKGLGERALHIGEAFGISFAIFKGIEFVKEAKEDWEKLEFANSQLEAGLESTGMAAGLTFKDLTESAEQFSHNLKFTKAEVEDMQSILLTFPSVTKDTFNSASQAILDMATRLGTDAKGAAIQLGKALQDPVAGLNALHRVGVNTDELKKKFETVTDTLQRQKLIIHELTEEFGGSAEAAAKADVSFRYEKSMHELSETIGELADKFVGLLAPALETFVSLLKGAVEWSQRNADLLKSIAIGVGVATSAWLIYKGVLLANIAIQKAKAAWDIIQIASMYTEAGAAGGLSVAMTIVTAAQYAWNAAITANPIGILIVGIGLLVTALVYCWNHFKTFRAVLLGVWETIKEFGRIVGDIFMGLWHVIHGVFTLSPSEVVLGGEQTVNAIKNAGTRMGDAFKRGYKEGVEGFDEDHKEQKEGTIKAAPKPKPLGKGEPVKEPKTKATGSKNITINVTIHSLIDKYTTSVTTTKESASKARDIVVQALTGAVNDFQIVADH